MANALNTDKQIAVIGALAEGSSMRNDRGISMSHLQDLHDAIVRLHGAEARHVESVSVVEEYHG